MWPELEAIAAILPALLACGVGAWAWKRTQRERARLAAENSNLTQTLDQSIAMLKERNGELLQQGKDLERLAAERYDANERAKGWQAKAEHWQQQFEAANADAIASRETVADWIAQRTFGRSIFGKGPALPEQSTHPQPVPKPRMQARVAVQLAEANFEKAMAEQSRPRQSKPGE
jgi:hypothetical protein